MIIKININKININNINNLTISHILQLTYKQKPKTIIKFLNSISPTITKQLQEYPEHEILELGSLSLFELNLKYSINFDSSDYITIIITT